MDSIEKAADMLFGKNGGVKNIRFYPGTDFDATPTQRAEELLNIFERGRQGSFRVIK